ncbi:MAG TPA: 1-deoxy-D-xylulose-5-phosphate reductoisomerase [Lachnospiraceae bacterium]|nr:1-deoxy-D-xylulose-5-phosphate reductoisomerase [Lachnospiraceae bacterium]
MKNLVILGSTGSIGTQALDIARAYPDRLNVIAISCDKNTDRLKEQIKEFDPLYAVVSNEEAFTRLNDSLKDDPSFKDHKTVLLSGMDGLIKIASLSEADIVLTAVVGMIGIRPTIAAINAGKDIALANKETLVCAGHIIMPLIKEKNVKLLPVDSEHSAIFQSLQGRAGNKIKKILLTASGGPFRGLSYDELKGKTAAEALKHPNWSMGNKITIDSASMVNKGLEVMEACHLFNVTPDEIEVVIHPQSILHSAVEYEDGAVIGQMGLPDMKLPIQYALFYPERLHLEAEKLDLFKIKDLTFEKPDLKVFKGLALAYEAFKIGGSMPTVYNAANEKAVALFLNNRIGFTDIYDLIENAMDKHEVISDPDVDQILYSERFAYETIEEFMS